jgi:hypothetical protein
MDDVKVGDVVVLHRELSDPSIHDPVRIVTASGKDVIRVSDGSSDYEPHVSKRRVKFVSRLDHEATVQALKEYEKTRHEAECAIAVEYNRRVMSLAKTDAERIAELNKETGMLRESLKEAGSKIEDLESKLAGAKAELTELLASGFGSHSDAAKTVERIADAMIAAKTEGKTDELR